MTATNTPIRILFVDDHPMVREGLAGLISRQQDMQVVAEASTGAEAIQIFQTARPDVTLLDLRLPDLHGIDVINAILRESPGARILVLTSHEGDIEIRRALQAGAYGYLLKGMEGTELMEAIRQVHSGKKHIPPSVAAKFVEHLADETLTAREIEVLQLVASGNRNKEIAGKLFISEETVRMHMKNILAKLGANERTHAVIIALQRGILRV